MGHARLSGDEIEQRGVEVYQKQIRPIVETEENIGRICAIDVETGEYFVAKKVMDAAQPLHEKHPGAAVWGVQIGSDTVDELSGAMNFELLEDFTAWDRISDESWKIIHELERGNTERKN